MSFSKVVLFACLAFTVGIFAASLFHFSKPILSGFFIFGLLSLAALIFKRKFAAIIGVLLIFFALGIWRYQLAEQDVLVSKLLTLNDSEKKITLVGVVAAEPEIRDTNIKLKIEPVSVVGSGSTTPKEGKILVTLPRYPEYSYGDTLRIIGELQTPAELEDFNYRDYLKKDGIYSVMYWPEVELLARGQGNFVYAKILEAKSRLRDSIWRNLSPPQSAILGAMMLGDKSSMSKELKEKLNLAGVRHITAISGMHVAVMTTIFMVLLLGIGLWRQQAFYLTISIITLFIIMTGLQPSAVRAGIMGGIFLLAQHLGRLNDSARAIVFAAAIMLALNPFLLRFDVGFQLSFAAMMGIIYLLPVFANWFRRLPDARGLKGILVMTLSAYIFTAPILIYNFGQISLVGILANLLIVPLLSPVMAGGFLFALAGIVWQPLGWLLSWPSWLLLSYIIKLVEWFSSTPFAALTFQNVHWVWLFAAYLVISLITWRLRQKLKFRFLGPI